MLKRMICLLLALCFLPLCAVAELEDKLPDALQVTQKEEYLHLTGEVYIHTYYPHTYNAEVDATLREILADMTARARVRLPSKAKNKNDSCVLDCGPSVYRTGDRWVSFLCVAVIRDGREQIYTDFEALAYDMISGRQLTLRDVIADDEGLALVSAAAREQLAAYFPQEEADAATLDALTSVETLESVPFTLNTAFLQLHYRADALYGEKNTLMHVQIPYSALREHMTDTALVQTDNSNRKLIALTLDDGPTRGRTMRCVRNLRAGGANATFFIVGNRIYAGHDELSFAHDAGFAIGSHNYEHIYKNANKGKVISFRDKLNAELTAVIGREVSIMRAPGGHEQIFIDEDVHLPLIHWSVISKSNNSVVEDPGKEARRLANLAKDGDIILMHDLYTGTDKIFLTLPELLAEKGFLCVTVEELFAARGIELLPNEVYWNAYAEE